MRGWEALDLRTEDIPLSYINNFEDLKVWQKARELSLAIFRVTNEGLFARDFGLRDQIRRAAVSAMSNIAEGFERGTNKEFIHFLFISKASAGEVRSQLYVALDQGYITNEQFDELKSLVLEVSRITSKLVSYLAKSGMKGTNR